MLITVHLFSSLNYLLLTLTFAEEITRCNYVYNTGINSPQEIERRKIGMKIGGIN
uniref:Uncharacterized protein n=1 Tax=Picea glauca TaxID=3330 RepID=A0A101LYX4_PICGL|nr:hypothetical protein ABT39_MTgene4919 [Picea glauca]QHR88615.1 hypothetical protein Q903MT_gene2629 [Picea sitchensis]